MVWAKHLYTRNQLLIRAVADVVDATVEGNLKKEIKQRIQRRK
jgi:hypothetical protein